MRCVKVTSEVDAWSVIHRIGQKCDLMETFDLKSKEAVYDMFLNGSTIYKFMSDNYSRVYAVAILEVQDDRSANLHFSMFQSCHILRGWKLLLEQLDHIDLLYSYIKESRQDIYKLLVMLKFQMQPKEQGYFYGQFEKEKETKAFATHSCYSERHRTVFSSYSAE